MKKYKLWILVLTALTVFFVVQVESLKATSLIHAGRFTKPANTTTTTTPPSSASSSSSSESPSNDRLRAILDEMPDDDDVIEVNGTKITLTGIPQIDYVWDPNLPRELNGYNLSSYPFLDSMPADEDISFDCEDKKNGFYASIKYSCQLYHHCLYGVRSDFICANFTAFDQKTFICHFVSEVDCKNSYKYWSRNDDLYKATTAKSTTTSSTVVPLFDRGFYNRTRHAFLSGSLSSSSQANNNNNNNNSPQATAQSNLNPSPNNNNNNSNSNNNRFSNTKDDSEGRPMRPLRRPPYRRRPARPALDYYYYDDEYEEDLYDERGRRRNRPRNRRPIYDEYESRRPENRRPYYDDDFDDYEYERRPLRNRNRNDERRRGYEDRRGGDRRRPYYDDDRRPPIDERRRNADRKPPTPSDERKFPSDLDDKRNENRRRNNYELNDKNVKQKEEETISDEKLVKPQSGSIFDRARPLPKINRPVPLNEKSKFAYKNTDKSTASKEEDDYAHEYDDDIPKSSTTIAASTTTTTTRTISALSPKPFNHKLKPTITQQTTTAKSITTTVSDAEYYDDEYYDTPSSTPIVESSSISAKEERIPFAFKSRYKNEPNTTPTTTAASSPDSFRLNRYSLIENNNNNRQQSSFIADSTAKKAQQTINAAAAAASDGENVSKKYANKQTVFDHVTQETPPKLNTQNLFQNLYNNRNLDNQRQPETKEDATQTQSFESKDVALKRPFLPSRGGNPFKARGLQPVGVFAQQSTETHENINNPSQQSKLDSHKITLEDLYNEEYDVDLNDALNPMLKPLTSSRGISESNNQQPIVGASDRADAIKAQNQKAVQQNVAESAPAVGTTEQPEYYDDELEYTYADDVA